MHGTHLRVCYMYPAINQNDVHRTTILSLYLAANAWLKEKRRGEIPSTNLHKSINQTLEFICKKIGVCIYVNNVTEKKPAHATDILNLVTRKLDKYIIYCPVFSYRNDILYWPTTTTDDDERHLMHLVDLIPAKIPAAGNLPPTTNMHDVVHFRDYCGDSANVCMYMNTPETMQIMLVPNTASTDCAVPIMSTIPFYFKLYMAEELKLWVHFFRYSACPSHIFDQLRQNLFYTINSNAWDTTMQSRVKLLWGKNTRQGHTTASVPMASSITVFFAYTVLYSIVTPATMSAFLLYDNIPDKDKLKLQMYTIMYTYHAMRLALTVTQDSIFRDLLNADCCKAIQPDVELYINALPFNRYNSDEVDPVVAAALRPSVLQTVVVIIPAEPEQTALPTQIQEPRPAAPSIEMHKQRPHARLLAQKSGNYNAGFSSTRGTT